MIIRVNSVEDMKHPVNRCKSAVNKGDGANSLHACLLLEATTDGLTGRLSITAVDTRSHQLTLTLPEGLVDVQEPGQALVPYDFISELLNKLPAAASLDLEVDSSNRMQVHCGPDNFEVFLHQGSVDDYRLAMISIDSLPDEVCRVSGPSLTRLIGEAATVINDTEEFKLLGKGQTLHAFTHDRNSSIVSHAAVDSQDFGLDWGVSVVSRLIKLVHKYWLDDVSIHLREGESAMMAFRCNGDFFALRQLSTEIDVSVLEEALAKDMVGHFVVDGGELKNKSKLLDLAKGEIHIEVRSNLVKFASSYAQRGNNDVKLSTLAVDGQQPKEKFNRDLVKKAILAIEASQVQVEWVPLDEDGNNFFLRFTDADAPESRAIMITPVQ